MNQEVYIIAQIEVKDYESYSDQYALKFKKILPDYQGEVLAATEECEILEGGRYGNWTVVIKFPNRQLAYNCINSQEYAPLKKVRINELTTGNNVLMIPGK